MLVNRIMKHEKKITSLSDYLSSFEKDSTNDRTKRHLLVKFVQPKNIFVGWKDYDQIREEQ
jgi:hypothetical protein